MTEVSILREREREIERGNRETASLFETKLSGTLKKKLSATYNLSDLVCQIDAVTHSPMLQYVVFL